MNKLVLIIYYLLICNLSYSQENIMNYNIKLGYHFQPITIYSTTINDYNPGPHIIINAQYNFTKLFNIIFSSGIKYYGQKSIRMELQRGGYFNSRSGSIYKIPLSFSFGFKGTGSSWRPFIYGNCGVNMTIMTLKSKDYRSDPLRVFVKTDDASSVIIPTAGVKTGIEYLFNKKFGVSVLLIYEYERWHDNFSFESYGDFKSTWQSNHFNRIYDINMKIHTIYFDFGLTYYL